MFRIASSVIGYMLDFPPNFLSVIKIIYNQNGEFYDKIVRLYLVRLARHAHLYTVSYFLDTIHEYRRLFPASIKLKIWFFSFLTDRLDKKVLTHPFAISDGLHKAVRLWKKGELKISQFKGFGENETKSKVKFIDAGSAK